MKFGTLDGRFVLVEDGRALDVATASGGALPADVLLALARWDEVRSWAPGADWTTAVAVTDEQLVAGIRLLAETTGIFTETAGGVTVAAALALSQQGVLKSDDEIVLCITGNGLKTTDALAGRFEAVEQIAPKLAAFEEFLETQFAGAPAASFVSRASAFEARMNRAK